MKIIISPAKKMITDTDSLECRGLPMYLDRTQQLMEILKSMSYDQLKQLWRCNDKIALLNRERLDVMDLRKRLTPAIFSYEGIQYQYMAPGVFTYEELDYIQDRLIILSGFYGMLRPFDGVVPYRLEMQAALSGDGFKSLYGFWGDILAGQLASETDTIINLASKEYSRVISDSLPGEVRFISCVFAEQSDSRLVEKGTLCKMARGEMVRYMAENNVNNPEGIKNFSRLGYCYSGELSDESTFVFVKKTAEKD